jgi:hypothetical protein
MLTKKQTGGGDYLFVLADGSATWLTDKQVRSITPLGQENKKEQPEAIGCPYTGNACTRRCAAANTRNVRITDGDYSSSHFSPWFYCDAIDVAIAPLKSE